MVKLRQFLDNRKSQPCTGPFFRHGIFNLLKLFKNPLQILPGHADSLICDTDTHLPRFFHLLHADENPAVRRRKLQGIGQQIVNNLPQHLRVGHNFKIVRFKGSLHDDVGIGAEIAHFINNRFHKSMNGKPGKVRFGLS